jgi:hypothetical protein
VLTPQLVLCGDPNQCAFRSLSDIELVDRCAIVAVGPIVCSEAARDAELDVSLLERLFERSLYRDHLKARGNMYGRHGAPAFVPFTNLAKVGSFTETLAAVPDWRIACTRITGVTLQP